MSKTVVMANREKPSGCNPLLLNVTEVADLCGLSPKSIRRLARNGVLPRGLRIGRSVRWRREEIEEWVSAGCPSLE